MAPSSISLSQLAASCATEGLTPRNGERIAAVLAVEFKVRLEEIGILRLENESLVFVHPAKLHNLGRIPLNNSSSVAVRTLNTKRPEIMNNFTKTKHTTFFEMVDLSSQPPQPAKTARAGDPGQPPQHTKTARAGDPGQQAKPGENSGKDYQTIQKLMSVPVIAAGKVAGVIQVSRKGKTLIAAGPDFVTADLQKLVGMAGTLASCFK